MNLFSTPFTVPIDDVPGNMQIEITDLQWNGGLKKTVVFFDLHEHSSRNSITCPANSFPLWNYLAFFKEEEY